MWLAPVAMTLAPVVLTLTLRADAQKADAQERDPYRFVPKDAVVVVEFAPVAQLVERFAATRVGALVNDPICAPFRTMLADFWRNAQRNEEGGPAIAHLLETLGEKLAASPHRVVASFGGGGRSAPAGEPSMGFSFVIRADEGGDFEPVVEAFQSALAAQELDAIQTEIGGRAFWFCKDERERRTALSWDGVDLVVVDGASVLEVIEELSESGGSGLRPSVDANGSDVVIAIDVERAVELGVTDELDLDWIEESGLSNMSKLEVAVRARGEHVETDLIGHLAPGTATCLDTFRPAGDHVERLRRLVPRDASSWLSVGIDVDAFAAAIKRDSEDVRRDIFAGMQEALGFDVSGMGPHMDGSLAMMARRGVDASGSASTVICVMLGHSDSASIERAIRGIAAELEITDAIEKSDYRGHSVRSVAQELHFAVLPRAFVYSVGAGGGAMVRAVIDRKIDVANGVSDGFSKFVTDRFGDEQLRWDVIVALDSLWDRRYVAEVVSALARLGLEGNDHPVSIVALRLVRGIVSKMGELDLLDVAVGLRFEDEEDRVRLRWVW